MKNKKTGEECTRLLFSVNFKNGYTLKEIETFDLYSVICYGWEPIGEEKPGYYTPTGERI